ncbi:MAG: hypothetical protein JWR72_2077 [Flavisolibacter sp.]|nr:hypothetical protein [Flavisolibacter sp.]
MKISGYNQAAVCVRDRSGYPFCSVVVLSLSKHCVLAKKIVADSPARIGVRPFFGTVSQSLPKTKDDQQWIQLLLLLHLRSN